LQDYAATIRFGHADVGHYILLHQSRTLPYPQKLSYAALPSNNQNGTFPMNPVRDSFIAAVGVFAGSLLWDVFFGDGIQGEDVFQAGTVAVVAALIQLWLSRKRSG
jgi:hypothetical protein